MKQTLVTSAIPFALDKADAVDAKLAALVPELRDGGEIRDALRLKGIHFMTVTVVRGGAGEPTYLLFEINADGEASDAYALVNDNLKTLVTGIFAVAGIHQGGEFGVFLARHRIRTGQGLFDVPGLDFCGTPGMTVSRIRAERDLAREIRNYLDANPPAAAPLALLGRIRAHVAAIPELSPLLSSEPVARLAASSPNKLDPLFILSLLGLGLLKFFWPVLLLLGVLVVGAAVAATSAAGGTVGVITFLVGLIFAAFALLGVLVAVYFGLRRLEAANTPDDSAPDARILEQVIAYENWSQQNHLAGISIMQPGWLRGLTLRIAFWVIQQMAAKRFRPGFLGEIGTIHFARWVRLPKTNKLLFFSNYGGSWQSYLEDFITKASFGLTGAWSNTAGFPRTRNLFQDGAVDGDRFKRWARRQQQPTRFWYSAYPDLTTARIRTNAAIRQGLCTISTEDEAAAWLGLFGSKVRPDTLLETFDIQTLLFGGLSKHPYAACLALALPDDPAAARRWLGVVEPQVSFGDQPPPDKVLILGLAESGLAKLGLPESVRSAFPTAYRMGMGSPARANILADTGDDKPQRWLWGGLGREADAALLVYAAEEAILGAMIRILTTDIQGHGGNILHKVTPVPLPRRDKGQSGAQVGFEPFGFADGVSQPIIKGTRRWMRQSDAIHTVEPGEFLLGYPDSRGFFPPSPTVPASADPANRLPLADPVYSRGAFQPDFRNSGANATRDFGRNGTFLVIRQLEQDIGAFNTFLTDAATRYAGHPAVPQDLSQKGREEWVGAKMVGRWRNGTSLVRFPHRPGEPRPGEAQARPDNEFLYGAEDPLGERCPLGAHIRRTNPRESFEAGSKEELSIVNRHRILRVGRAFDAAGSGDPHATKPGLLFMCLNADIERQFEFIQQTWSMSWQFHGLENEVDPIVGRGNTMGRLTVPSTRGPLHLTGVKDFVRVRGGGYFFMPGRRALSYLTGL